MNIHFFSHHSTTPMYIGNKRTFDYASKFAELGHRVCIVSSSFIHRTDKDILEGTKKISKVEEINDNLRFMWVKTFPKYSGNNYRRFINMLSYFVTSQLTSLNCKPDIIIGTSPTPFASLSAWLWSRRLGSRFVLEVRDLWPQYFVDLGFFKKNHPLVKLFYSMENFLYRKADLVVTSLPFAYNYFKARGFDTGKLVFIPNGIDLAAFERLYNEHGLHDLPLTLKDLITRQKERGAKLIVYAGGLSSQNDLEVVIKAAALLQSRTRPAIAGAAFLFVGDGAEKAKLMDLTKRLCLENVYFHPPIPRRLVPSLLKAADYTILHVRKSPLGRYGLNPQKVYDYLAAGVPVIFAADAPNDIVKASGCGVSVPPGDPEAIVEAVNRLLSLPDSEIARMRKSGKKYISKFHNLDRLARMYISILNNVMEKNPDLPVLPDLNRYVDYIEKEGTHI